MKRDVFGLILLLVGGSAVVAYHKANAPDLYAQCNQKQTAHERSQCTSQINLAMGAGW